MGAAAPRVGPGVVPGTGAASGMLSEEPGSRRGGRNPPVGTAPAPCRGQVLGPTGAAPWLVPVCYCSPWGQTSAFFNLILFYFYPIWEGRSGGREMRCSCLSTLRGEPGAGGRWGRQEPFTHPIFGEMQRVGVYILILFPLLGLPEWVLLHQSPWVPAAGSAGGRGSGPARSTGP